MMKMKWKKKNWNHWIHSTYINYVPTVLFTQFRFRFSSNIFFLSRFRSTIYSFTQSHLPPHPSLSLTIYIHSRYTKHLTQKQKMASPYHYIVKIQAGRKKKCCSISLLCQLANDLENILMDSSMSKAIKRKFENLITVKIKLISIKISNQKCWSNLTIILRNLFKGKKHQQDDGVFLFSLIFFIKKYISSNN